MSYRIGIDIGGTFTDLVVASPDGEVSLYKTPTTPEDPSLGLLNALELAAEDRAMPLKDFLPAVGLIVHGTTITTNAVLTGRGARCGFVTTKGFRDVLNMRRGLKPRPFESFAPPAQLIPRQRIQVVEERITVDGTVEVPLNEEDVRRAGDFFREAEVEAVAVSCLWSFRNPTHEVRIREILQEALPEIYISLSSDVLPQIRVYERHSTTALNAYVGPVLERYLLRLQEELSRHGFVGTLLIMQSNGGVIAPELARRYAANTLLSGPAGGALAGVFYGATHGLENVATIDMGGTSFDVSLVAGGVPTVTTEGEIAGHRVALPTLDIHTVGAGGGSIAWIDAGGLLRVGPQSAGADPGPASYNRGGKEATVTDADLVLGYLDPAFFAGGSIPLDSQAANDAIGRLAEVLQLGNEAVAAGIHDVVNASMAAALEVVSIQRGHNPRDFALVVAGGAGPIHAAAIAQELDIPLILIPRESSVFCATGMLISDLKHDYVRTYPRDLADIDFQEMRELFRQMETAGRDTLASEGAAAAAVEIHYSADFRYVGQFGEVAVPFADGIEAGPPVLSVAVEAFHARHEALYGYAMPDAPIELLNLRVSSRGITEKPQFARLELGDSESIAARKGTRDAYFDGRFAPTPVFDGLELQPGNVVSGPAIVEQPTTTIVVPPGLDLSCDAYRNYMMARTGADPVQLLSSEMSASGHVST